MSGYPVLRYSRRFVFSSKITGRVLKDHNLGHLHKAHINLLNLILFTGGPLGLSDIKAATQKASKYNLPYLRHLVNAGLLIAHVRNKDFQRDWYTISQAGIDLLNEIEAAIKRSRPPDRWTDVKKRVEVRNAKVTK